jgi:hypothetical protein
MVSVFQTLEVQSGGCHWYHYKTYILPYDDSSIICSSEIADAACCKTKLMLGKDCDGCGSAYNASKVCYSCIVFWIILIITAISGVIYLIKYIRRRKSGNYNTLE